MNIVKLSWPGQRAQLATMIDRTTTGIVPINKWGGHAQSIEAYIRLDELWISLRSLSGKRTCVVCCDISTQCEALYIQQAISWSGLDWLAHHYRATGFPFHSVSLLSHVLPLTVSPCKFRSRNTTAHHWLTAHAYWIYHGIRPIPLPLGSSHLSSILDLWHSPMWYLIKWHRLSRYPKQQSYDTRHVEESYKVLPQAMKGALQSEWIQWPAS